MTTVVTVNAHAGWPVLVTTKQGEPGQEKSIHTTTVEPMTERAFYIHSGLQIVGIEEQPRPATGVNIPEIDKLFAEGGPL